MMKEYPKGVGLITLQNHCWTGSRKAIITSEGYRFFPKKYYHYEETIHEQLCPLDGQEHELVNLPLTVEHFGYFGTPEELRAKAERNNKLLFQQLEKTPDDPYLYFQIGQSYDLFNDDENACLYYGKALEFDLNPELEYVQELVLAYGHSLLALGRFQDALAYENIYESFHNSADFVCLMGRIYLKNGMYIKAMSEFLKATTFETAVTEGNNSYIPLYYMGYINELLGNREDAIRLYERCGSYEPAMQHLQNLSN
jgi:hypothetical protein